MDLAPAKTLGYNSKEKWCVPDTISVVILRSCLLRYILNMGMRETTHGVCISLCIFMFCPLVVPTLYAEKKEYTILELRNFELWIPIDQHF